MDKRIALIGIIIEDIQVTDRVNGLLHSYATSIVGRMGLPYRERGLNIISIVIDDTQNSISALSGKLGAISGVSVKAMYSAGNYEKE